MKGVETQPLKKEGDLVYEPLPFPDQLEAATALGQFFLGLIDIRGEARTELPVIV